MNPRILITVEGGVIQDVTADGDVSVFILDMDNVKAGDKFDGTTPDPMLITVDRETMTFDLAQAQAESESVSA